MGQVRKKSGSVNIGKVEMMSSTMEPKNFCICCNDFAKLLNISNYDLECLKSFYYVNYGLSIITSKVHQIISVISVIPREMIF